MNIKYVGFLRGINVGGHRLKMELLRNLLSQLGLVNIGTYIQTGNVFFESTVTNVKDLTLQIEEHLYKNLGYKVPFFLRTVNQLEIVLEESPFKEMEETFDTRHFIVFVDKELDTSTAVPINSLKKDFIILKINSMEVYMLANLINGKLSSLNLVEKTFHVNTTSRFYHTTQKILDAAKVHFTDK